MLALITVSCGTCCCKRFSSNDTQPSCIDMPNAALILSPTTKITGSLAVTEETWKMTNISSVLEKNETILNKRESINNALQLKNITKSVNTAGQPLVILQGISLEIKQGETVSVVGVSGSGKSTMLGIKIGRASCRERV